MAKVRNYEALLALVETRGLTPFAFGPFDCIRWIGEVIQAQTGWNPLRGLRWNNLKEAKALIAAEGGIEAGVDRRLTRITPAMAMRGDVAGVRDEAFGIRLMMVEGATLVGPGDIGLRREPRSAMIMAWSADKPPRRRKS